MDLADEADRQERSGDAALREDFIITGISEPFELMQRISTRLAEIDLHVVQDGEEFSTRPLGLHHRVSSGFFLTNKLSFNLLQDRLACGSQPSLEGVMVTNLVVNFRRKTKTNFELAWCPAWLRKQPAWQVAAACSPLIQPSLPCFGRIMKLTHYRFFIGSHTLVLRINCSPSPLMPTMPATFVARLNMPTHELGITVATSRPGRASPTTRDAQHVRSLPLMIAEFL